MSGFRPMNTPRCRVAPAAGVVPDSSIATRPRFATGRARVLPLRPGSAHRSRTPRRRRSPARSFARSVGAGRRTTGTARVAAIREAAPAPLARRYAGTPARTLLVRDPPHRLPTASGDKPPDRALDSVAESAPQTAVAPTHRHGRRLAFPCGDCPMPQRAYLTNTDDRGLRSATRDYVN